jgi:hypothetical protein
VRKPRKQPVAAAPLSRRWTIATYAQWIPVATVAVSGIIWLTHLQDAVEALQQGASQVQVTQLDDRVGTLEKQQDKLEIKEANDMSEVKASFTQVWQYRSSDRSPKP